MDPLPAPQPEDAPGRFAEIFRLNGEAHHRRRGMQHQRGDKGQGHGDDPLAGEVDKGGRPGVASGPEEAGDIGDVHGLCGHHTDEHHAHDGVGRQHLGADGHVAHDGGHHADAQAPQRLVHQNGSGVFGKIPPDGAAGPQDGGGQQGHVAAAQGAHQSNEELHDAGGQCSHWPPR